MSKSTETISHVPLSHVFQGLVCDGAIGGHIAGRKSHEEKSEDLGGPQYFEQQTSF